MPCLVCAMSSNVTIKTIPAAETQAHSWVAWDRAASLALFRYTARVIPRNYMMLLEHSGNGLVWLALAIAIWCMPTISAQQRCAVTNFLLAFLVDLILVGSLKSLCRRPRPIYNSSGDFIMVVSVDQFSFPSGHASRCHVLHKCWCLQVFA